LWRTPEAGDCADRTFAVNSRGEPKLSAQVKLWRTPDAGCARGAQSEERFAESLEKHRLLTLNDQIAYLFPTPRVAGGMAHPIREPERIRDHRRRPEDYIALFPTPRATDGEKGTRPAEGSLKEPARGHGTDLGSSVRVFPTPTCDDSKDDSPPSQRTENGRHSDQLNVVAGGSLNPEWVEWLMGFPVGWTADIGAQSLTYRESPEA
jgi:hypothetical protein